MKIRSTVKLIVLFLVSLQPYGAFAQSATQRMSELLTHYNNGELEEAYSLAETLCFERDIRDACRFYGIMSQTVDELADEAEAVRGRAAACDLSPEGIGGEDCYAAGMLHVGAGSPKLGFKYLYRGCWGGRSEDSTGNFAQPDQGRPCAALALAHVQGIGTEIDAGQSINTMIRSCVAGYSRSCGRAFSEQLLAFDEWQQRVNEFRKTEFTDSTILAEYASLYINRNEVLDGGYVPWEGILNVDQLIRKACLSDKEPDPQTCSWVDVLYRGIESFKHMPADRIDLYLEVCSAEGAPMFCREILSKIDRL